MLQFLCFLSDELKFIELNCSSSMSMTFLYRIHGATHIRLMTNSQPVVHMIFKGLLKWYQLYANYFQRFSGLGNSPVNLTTEVDSQASVHALLYCLAFTPLLQNKNGFENRNVIFGMPRSKPFVRLLHD